MPYTDEDLNRAVGESILPKTIDSNRGLGGLLENTEKKVQHILEGPGTNTYRITLLKQVQASYYADVRTVCGWQFDGLLDILGKLGPDEVLPIPEFHFNRSLIKSGEKNKPSQSLGKAIVVDGVTYYPSTIQGDN